MAVTERDRATASQKCDPYAPGYEECETFLRGETTTPTRKLYYELFNQSNSTYNVSYDIFY